MGNLRQFFSDLTQALQRPLPHSEAAADALEKIIALLRETHSGLSPDEEAACRRKIEKLWELPTGNLRQFFSDLDHAVQTWLPHSEAAADTHEKIIALLRDVGIIALERELHSKGSGLSPDEKAARRREIEELRELPVDELRQFFSDLTQAIQVSLPYQDAAIDRQEKFIALMREIQSKDSRLSPDEKAARRREIEELRKQGHREAAAHSQPWEDLQARYPRWIK
ncbi:MAG: hypothetical protein ACYCUM_09225 [Solirubrobacteraceae bacterium]